MIDMGLIKILDKVFVLNTKRTSYAFRVYDVLGVIEHLYYGKRLELAGAESLVTLHPVAPATTVVYKDGRFSTEDVCLEFSTMGTGDTGEPFFEAVTENGNTSFDFKYEGYEIKKGKELLKSLPSSYAEKGKKAEQLILLLKDKTSGLGIKLIYSVFPECDVIVKSAVFMNNSKETIRLTRLLSNMFDTRRNGFRMTTFNGSWAREMKRTDTPVFAGTFVNSSFTGTSSNRSNPFVMLSDCTTTEDYGECYGFNLIYSGNHYEALEVNPFSRTRFVQGINPRNFEFVIKAGDIFEAPEAVMTYSDAGFNKMSAHMHDFVREHIVRGVYKKSHRPVLLNSWEAAYFDITTEKLLKLAKAGKDVGIELFVVDDGWFGERNDDSTSLGDWDVNEKKITGGLKKLAEKVNKLGIKFGIWVEPEMVNVKSKLYEAHPDWTIDVPGRPHMEGRNQRILDYTREDVRDYIVEKLSSLFMSAEISYVKWDMNRIFTDYYTKQSESGCQKEVSHRYVLGLYDVMDRLTKRFPEILFEGCSSGGNRFDLGMLCYFPQIWGSDNTDAVCRGEIQNNLSYGYPQSTWTSHVSASPNHQTVRETSMNTRFNMACFGVLGYELNLCELSKEELADIKKQIETYKADRDLLLYGSMYRGRSYGGDKLSNGSVLEDESTNILEWTISNKEEAMGMIFQKLVHPNAFYTTYMPKGLEEKSLYAVGVKKRPDVKIQMTEKSGKTTDVFTIEPDAQPEEFVQYGSALMYAGINMKEGFSARWGSDEVRFFPDFSAERFYMIKVNK